MQDLWHHCTACNKEEGGTSSDVCMPLISSTSFISGTGFMKCIPTWTAWQHQTAYEAAVVCSEATSQCLEGSRHALICMNVEWTVN